MKIVVNKDYSGFGLSDEALKLYCELSGREYNDETKYAVLNYVERHDKYLVEVVERLGGAANDRLSSLKIEEIPDGSYYSISDYDGVETLFYAPVEIQTK